LAIILIGAVPESKKKRRIRTLEKRELAGILCSMNLNGTANAAAADERWVGTWVSAQQLTEPANMPPAPGLTGNTLRQVVHATIGGRKLRVRFSNAYGTEAMTLKSARLAVSKGGASIDPATDTGLEFGGSPSVTIPAGGTAVSDVLAFDAKPFADLAVSLHFGTTPLAVTGHPGSRTTSYLQAGDAAAAADLEAAAHTDHWYAISGIDVLVAGSFAAIVTLGDSITDGRGSTTNGNDRWPDNLARRLQADPDTKGIAVLNQGVGGNAVTAGGLGPTALERFERDVLDPCGVRWLIVLEGVNDIGPGIVPRVAEALMAAYRLFIDKAHAKGIRVFGVPILPFGDSFYDSPDHEEARATVNDWIRTSGRFDAVIDLDAAVRDPAHTLRLLPAYDTGDHLHLSPAGYRKMADSIDLALFKESRS
jgi:lysophospholipase L1-like esterase